MIKNKLVFLLVIIIIMSYLISCRPTPNSEIVVTNGNNLDNSIIQMTSSEKYIAPASWIETINSDKTIFKISINASIRTPDIDKYFISSIKQRSYSQDDVDNIIGKLLKGEPLYEISNIKTKEEIEEKILYWKALLADKNNTDPEHYNDYESEYNIEINKLEDQLDDAPVSYERKLLDTNINNADTKLPQGDVIISDNLEGEEREGAEADATKLEDMLANVTFKRIMGEAFINPIYSTQITFTIDSKNSIFQYNNAPGGIKESGIDAENYAPISMQMTYEEAADLARELVVGMGINYMDIACAEIGIKNYEVHNMDDKSNPPQCYIFYFKRYIDGVPETYEQTTSSDSGGYAPSNFFEYLRIDIDDSGVLFIKWVAPTEYIGMQYDNVQLLPFEDIKSIFREQIFIRNEWNDNLVTEREIVIDRIQLGLVRIAQKNEDEEYLLVPAWDFFGNCIETSEDGIMKTNEIAKSFLTINAIDGSIIDRSLGY